jgi:hypothetical protein
VELRISRVWSCRQANVWRFRKASFAVAADGSERREGMVRAETEYDTPYIPTVN